MAADTLTVMDAAGIGAAHLVGHSLGGCVALEIALSQPERVRGLSLLCTSARGGDATRVTAQMAWLGARTRIGTRRMRRLAFLQLVMSPGYLAGRDRDAVAEELAEIFGHDLADTPAVAMRQLSALAKFDVRTRLGELAGVPALVVSAAGDIIFPPACGRALAEGIPGARFIEIADARHGVVIEHASAVNLLLAEHMGRAAPGVTG